MDASFAVHPDFKSHTREIITTGKRAMYSVFRKQKLSTRIRTEYLLVAVDNTPVCIFWMVLFIEWKG